MRYAVSDPRVSVNDDLEGMWLEVIVAYFKVLSQHSVEGRRRSLSQDIRCPGRDWNSWPSEYESVITINTSSFYGEPIFELI
jgi:hypothetical protein